MEAFNIALAGAFEGAFVSAIEEPTEGSSEGTLNLHLKRLH